uniref:NADH-ubiquinone oxidoreductase chain 5 n=1 Tax=Macrocheles muscaedomesticae TaxID=406086 RepID=A0A6B9WCM3_9ACAR|nr:NADH dehydrogenase subunit 5 [Macrocheles muscaedomesticae]QHQ98529.1 NADH dehydrogenase subunit 5 [Macrocheles muscaedomesticae]
MKDDLLSYFLIPFFFFFLSMFFLLSDIFFMLEYNLFSLFVCDVNIYFYFDWMSCVFLTVVLYISSMVLLYSDCYMMMEKNKKIFLLLVLLFILSMLLMIICLNLFTILIGWDGLGLVSYCLVAYYQNEASQVASLLTVMTNRIGDVGMLMGIIYMMQYGTWNFLEFKDFKVVNILIVMLLLAALTKSAQLPFSSWLPAAMAAPTPVSALVHSSTLVTAGVYLLLRFFFFFFSGNFSDYLFIVSLMTTLLAGMAASFEMDLKKVIAMSTLSQLGTMFLVVSLGEYILGFFHLISHAVIKAMLFLAAGVVIHASGGYQDMRKLVSIKAVSPAISSFMLIGCLSLSGFPFSSGFYSKDTILEFLYTLHFNYFIIFLVFLTIIFTVIYSFRICYFSIFMGGFSMVYYNKVIEKEFVFSIFMLCLFSICFGSLSNWGCFTTFYMFYMTTFWKMLNNIIFLVLFMMYYKSMKMMSMKLKFKFYSYFCANMWFMPVVNIKILKFFSNFGNYSKVVDNCWIEELGSKGMYSYYTFFGSLMYSLQGVLYTSFLFMLIMFLVLMMS